LITVGQKTYNGFVVDKNTGMGISYATIGLIKENKGVSANEQGAFSIHSSSNSLDSLRISSVGYETQILSLSEWKNGRIIQLQETSTLLKDIIVTTNRSKHTLNKFNRCSWNSFQVGLEAIYQLAQRFEAPIEGMQLLELELCKDPAESIFRLRIYDIDSTTKGPGKDLADTVIEVKSKESYVRIDMEKSYIIIPGKSYFVAIEWLFIPYNIEEQKVKRNGKKTIRIFYKPFIRWRNNDNTIPGFVWQLEFNGKWASRKYSQNYNFQISTTLR